MKRKIGDCEVLPRATVQISQPAVLETKKARAKEEESCSGWGSRAALLQPVYRENKSVSSDAYSEGGESVLSRDSSSGTREAQTPRHWTDEEDELLRKAVEGLGAREWKRVALQVPGRTHTQCLQRWNKVLRPGLRKGPWTESEDQILREMMETLLPMAQKKAEVECAKKKQNCDPLTMVEWSYVSEHIPGRSIKQCRERWCYNLDPGIKKGNWTPEEDQTLLEMQAQLGNRWARISRMLPGRTEHTVKTRFRSIMRARKREWKPEEDEKLLRLHRAIGSRWDEIARHLPNRTKNAVSTRFKLLQLSNEIKGNQQQSKTKSRPVPELHFNLETAAKSENKPFANATVQAGSTVNSNVSKLFALHEKTHAADHHPQLSIPPNLSIAQMSELLAAFAVSAAANVNPLISSASIPLLPNPFAYYSLPQAFNLPTTKEAAAAAQLALATNLLLHQHQQQEPKHKAQR